MDAFSSFSLLSALQSLPSSAIEAARIDGATRWQTILHVKLPLMLPVIVVRRCCA